MRIPRLFYLILILLFVFNGSHTPGSTSAEHMEPSIRVSLDLGSDTVSVRHLGDLDGDGALDIVINDHTNHLMKIMEQTDSGLLTTFNFYTDSKHTDSVVADFDEDGVLEIATISQASPGVLWIH